MGVNMPPPLTPRGPKIEDRRDSGAPDCGGVGGFAAWACAPIAPTATANRAPITAVLFNSCANAIATTSVSKAQTPLKHLDHVVRWWWIHGRSTTNRVMSRILLGVAMIIL
jgi:hypothetical protein